MERAANQALVSPAPLHIRGRRGNIMTLIDEKLKKKKKVHCEERRKTYVYVFLWDIACCSIGFVFLYMM